MLRPVPEAPSGGFLSLPETACERNLLAEHGHRQATRNVTVQGVCEREQTQLAVMGPTPNAFSCFEERQRRIANSIEGVAHDGRDASWAMCHASYAMCHASYAICHVPCVICQVPCDQAVKSNREAPSGGFLSLPETACERNLLAELGHRQTARN